jgi:acyl-CoA thioesterase-1
MKRMDFKLMRRFLSILMAVLISLSLSPLAWAESKTLLVIGDSLVAGYGLPQGVAFPDQLQEALEADGADVAVINAGISGDTMAGGASRIAWSLADQPDAMIVVFGGNDALRGLSPENMREQLDVLLRAIQDQHLPVLVAGMRAPLNMGASYGQAFDQAFADAITAAKKRSPKVVFYPFFLDGVALDPELNQDDGIHPNIDGVAVIVEKIMPAVKALLAQTQ